jgi:hypothetical protein
MVSERLKPPVTIDSRVIQSDAAGYVLGPLPQSVGVADAGGESIADTHEQTGSHTISPGPGRLTIETLPPNVAVSQEQADPASTPSIFVVGGPLPPILARAEQSISLGGTANPTLIDKDVFYSPTITQTEAADTAQFEGRVTPPDRIVIIRTVQANQAVVQLTALSLLSALELKIETLRATGSNSEIVEFDDLKRRVEEFLAANAKCDETPIADTTLSIADGLRRFWTEKHVSICEKTLDMTLFGAGLAFCGAAGVLAVPTAVTVGALVGRKDVVEALKAAAKIFGGDGTGTRQ